MYFAALHTDNMEAFLFGTLQSVEKACILTGDPNQKRNGIDRWGEKTPSGFLSPSLSFSRFWKEKEISRSAERDKRAFSPRYLLANI